MQQLQIIARLLLLLYAFGRTSIALVVHHRCIRMNTRNFDHLSLSLLHFEAAFIGC